METQSKSIRVAVLGLDERSQLVLSDAFRKNGKGLCRLAYSGNADIGVIDLDHTKASSLFKEFRKTFPDIPLIGISTQESKLAVNTQIPKPVDLNLLLAAIIELTTTEGNMTKNTITEDKFAQAMKALENKNIAKSLHKRAEDSRAKGSARRAIPNKNDEMCFDPERFLLGAVLMAVNLSSKDNQIAVLTCWNDKIIIFDPVQDTISSNLNDNQIRNLAIAPIDDNLSSPINVKFYKPEAITDGDNGIPAAKDLRLYSKETFLWNLGLLTCRGRIPIEFTVSNRHYLKRWPNLTRMKVPDNALRILSYWSHQPCSLSTIKEQLDVPFQDVFTIFSAAYAAGLTGEAKRKSDQLLQSVDLTENGQRGLMRSIINRLRGQKSQNLTKSA